MSATINAVILGKPVMSIGNKVEQITFREPTGRDLVAAGYPMRFTGSGATEVDPTALSKMIGRLGNITEQAVGDMSIPDWHKCLSVVMGFFKDGATAATPSTDTSNADGSGGTSLTPLN